MLDKRNAQRARVLLGGILIHGPRGFTADCTIRNVSDAGARIRVESSVELATPIVFVDVQTGRAFNAASAWRKGDEIGLEFVDELDIQAPATEVAALAQRLLLARRRR